MSFRDDLTHVASAEEMVCDECQAFPCDCPPSDVYDEPMTDAEYEAEKAAFAKRIPSVADIRTTLRAAWGTEGEVFGRSLETSPKGRRALDLSHEGDAA